MGVFLVADAPKKNDLNRGNIISISEGFLSNDSRPFIEIIFPVKRFFGENSKNLKNQTSKGDNLFKSVVAPPVDHFSEKKFNVIGVGAQILNLGSVQEAKKER